MVNFYYNLIINEEINANTGEPWKIEDVPKMWRAKVQAKLDEK